MRGVGCLPLIPRLLNENQTGESKVAHLEAEEPDSEAAVVLRARLRELAGLKEKKERQLQAAERELAQRPSLDTSGTLLEQLPLHEMDARSLSEADFRGLLEAMQLEASYDPRARQMTVSVVISPTLLGPEGTPPTTEMSETPVDTGRNPATSVHGFCPCPRRVSDRTPVRLRRPFV